MQYTTEPTPRIFIGMLFYQDFKDTFVCNTQPCVHRRNMINCCFIRISKILLYAIHNRAIPRRGASGVVLSGFQRYFCMQYTTPSRLSVTLSALFYQDFKDTFGCNTQPFIISSLMLCVVLSWFQRYICMQYTTMDSMCFILLWLFYLDFKDTFGCNTQPLKGQNFRILRCFIRISKILLYAIHNRGWDCHSVAIVVLSWCQWTILLQKYRKNRKYANLQEIILIF